MQKYCKVIDEEKGLVEVGLGDNIEFYQSIGMELRNVEQSDIDNLWYLEELCPHKTDEQKLIEAKELKIKENDLKRDYALNYGVEYKGILFDSDTDQKVNLIDTYSILKDDETITWLGKNNEPLECNKEDLNNIGNLIRHQTTLIWGLNAKIKNKIEKAENIEELNSIEIDYNMEVINYEP